MDNTNEHRQLLDKVGQIGVFGECLGLVFISGMIIMAIFAAVVVVEKRQRQQRQIALARQRALAAASSGTSGRNDASSYPSSIQQRKAHMEAYLVTKPALAHDILCDCARDVVGANEVVASTPNLLHFATAGGTGIVLRNYFVNSATAGPSLAEEKDPEDGSSSCNTNIIDTHDQNEGCTICFEAFSPNELVSWSPNPACCQRVFHHACYKEWLLRNKHCPWCREIVLPVDGYTDVRTTKRQIHDLLIAQQQRATPSFYCCTHGTVRPKTRAWLRDNNGGSLVPANLIIERSAYLCSRAEILKSTVALFGSNNNESNDPVLEETPEVATISSNERPETTTHSDDARHEDGRLDDVCDNTGSYEYTNNIEQSHALPIEKEGHQRTTAEENEDVDTGDEPSSSLNGPSSQGSNSLLLPVE